ncbi:MAG: FAD-dependent oxidoreductase, partial [Granulosicoccus sp.]|nr:FAD-dependent oxidoreductase [Granulosicoccus sp.]
MIKFTRRQFGAVLGTGAASILLPGGLLGQTRPRVVIVGGGAGGATAARYLAKDAEDQLDITLIDDSDTYTTCFYSNLYLG